MKILYYSLVLLACLSISSSAMMYNPFMELKRIAKENDMNNTIKTVHMIDYAIENTIEYEFYWYPRGISTTWRDKKGDCTDKAQIKVFMLNYLGIKSRTIHGYLEDGSKHDYYEVYYNNTWYNTEPDTKKVGVGVW